MSLQTNLPADIGHILADVFFNAVVPTLKNFPEFSPGAQEELAKRFETGVNRYFNTHGQWPENTDKPMVISAGDDQFGLPLTSLPDDKDREYDYHYKLAIMPSGDVFTSTEGKQWQRAFLNPASPELPVATLDRLELNSMHGYQITRSVIEEFGTRDAADAVKQRSHQSAELVESGEKILLCSQPHATITVNQDLIVVSDTPSPVLMRAGKTYTVEQTPTGKFVTMASEQERPCSEIEIASCAPAGIIELCSSAKAFKASIDISGETEQKREPPLQP